MHENQPRTVKRVVLVILATSLALAVPAGADKDVHEMPVTAHDEATPCVQDTAPCLAIETVTGLIEDDDQLALTFENNGTQPHSLLIAPGSSADAENGTPAEAAFVELGTIEPGESVEATVDIPEGTDTLHLFCAEEDHEQRGMHLSRNVHPGGSVAEAENETIGPPGEDRIPMGPSFAFAAFILAGLLARRRG